MAAGLTYELKSLERLIITVHQNVIINESNAKEFQLALTNEIDRIKSALVTEVFSFEDEKHLERYIQYHHHAIIRLLDQVGNFIVHNGQDLFSKDFNLVSHRSLAGLLAFVERHFSKYFDQDVKAPESYIRLVRKEATGWLSEAREKLGVQGCDNVLIETAVYAFQKFITSNEERHSSYRMILYVKDLQKELEKIPISGGGDINSQVWSLALYLNYNSLKWFFSYTQFIESALLPLDSASAKLEVLSLQLKKLNQCQVKPGVAYNPLTDSLKNQLSGYVIEENEYLEKLQNLTKEHLVQQPPAPSSKLIFDLSVSQLTLLLKILVESKVLLNANVSELLRLVSKIALSKKTESISFESMRSKYYNIEVSTKDAVKKMLLRMVSSVEKLN